MKYRKNRIIILNVLFQLIICGCTNSQCIQNEIDNLKSEYISLNLDSMQKGLDLISSNREQVTQNSYTYIKYISSIQCSSCVIKSLRDWIRLQDIFDICNELSLIIIIHPKDYQTKRIIDEFKTDTIMLENVYLDTIGVFERVNSFLPKNTYLHSFLVDDKGKVLIVGDPTCDEIVEGELRNFIHNKFNALNK